MLKNITVYASLFMVCLTGFAVPAEANLFHVTQRAARKRIMKKGFSKAKMRSNARYGKGVYLADKKKTAISEVPKAQEVIRFKESKYLKKNTIDMRKPTPAKIRKVVPEKDLRGDVKKGVIGPKLGKKLGRAAGKKGKVIRYRSAKDPNGSNVVIPAKVHGRHPRIIKADRVYKIRKVKGMREQ